MAKKICRLCGDLKDEEEFYENRVKKPDGTHYVSRRTECRMCTDKRTRKYHQDNRDRVILNNCRRDRRNLECDLTREVVRDLIASPCQYCGETSPEKIGLDRVQNDVGYTRTNVVPCCIRCNSLKRDMPQPLWLRFVPLVRQLHEEGAFGDWMPHNRGSNEVGKKKSASPAYRDHRLRSNRDP